MPPAGPRPPVQTARATAAMPGQAVLVAGDSLSLFLAEALRPLLADRPGAPGIEVDEGARTLTLVERV